MQVGIIRIIKRKREKKYYELDKQSVLKFNPNNVNKFMF